MALSSEGDTENGTDRIARIWRSVFQPSADIEGISLPSFQNPESFHVDTASTLSWLCHAVYIQDPQRRRTLMAEVGLQEVCSFGTQELHWSQVTREDAPECHYVAFRGTSDLRHWVFNVNTLLMPWPGGGKVHNGFSRAYDKVAGRLQEALQESAPTQLCFTGHSLGGALALLAANRYPCAAVYTFGCPRTGNPRFVQTLAGIPVYRVVHEQDLVTTIPYEIDFLNDFAYKHAGRPVHVRMDERLSLDDETHLPHSVKSWRQALHAILEGEHTGEPLPALQDHAPCRYVSALQAARTGV